MIRYHLQSFLTLAILTGILLGCGMLLGGLSGLCVALAFAILSHIFLYFYSADIVLKLYKATPLSRSTHGWVYTTVQELSDELQIPMPRMWYVPQETPNAFATGRNPQNSSVALTAGIMRLLTPDELRAVLAHELCHIKHRDTLVTTVAVILATAISSIASMMRYYLTWHAWGNSSRKEDSSANIFYLLVLIVVVPIAASLLQLLLSRTREYLADEAGARACRDPLGLAHALEKIEYYAQTGAQPDIEPSTASMLFINPLKGTSWKELLSTHPSTQKRIERLRYLFLQKGP